MAVQRSSSIFQLKPIEDVLAQAGDESSNGETRHLRRRLRAVDLIGFGVGVVIGTGIFSLTGLEAKHHAGPAVIVSFVIAGIVAIMAAVCYAEMSSAVPTAGSAYTYAYATIGEVFAWIIGWDLILEFTLGAAVVSRAWSAYVGNLLGIPKTLFGEHAPVNVGAIIVIVILGLITLMGVKESSMVTNILVIIKVSICLFFIVVGAFFVAPKNWSPFVPPAQEVTRSGADMLTTPLTQILFGIHPQVFGIGGILTAAAVLFFTYSGFEVIANLGEETKNPKRDMPIGLIGTLVVAGILYMGVSTVLTGMVPYSHIDEGAPLAAAFEFHGMTWAAKLVGIAAMCGLTSAILVNMVAMGRIGFSLARDRLLPRSVAAIHPKWGTPHRITIATMVAVLLVGAFVPMKVIADMISIGTLFAFIIVALAVPVLRKRRPDMERPFKAPFSPVLPILSALLSFYLMLNLDLGSWLRFLAWLLIGFCIYFFWGHRNARLSNDDVPPTTL